MSRQEDFKKAADDYVEGEPNGAQKIVGQVGFEFGAEYGYQYAVEKVCELLEKNMFEKYEFDEYGHITQTYACSDDCSYVSEFVEQIRKAMED